jgi:2-aminoadipate transaminase
MATGSFDFAPLLPAGLPPAAARWTGLAKYSFVGGNNDPDQVPVDGLIDAVNVVLRREGRALATYGLASGPQGYRPLREFLVGKLKRDAGIACSADDILIVSGSLQALDLVNHTLLARGDTVIIEQDSYQGALNRLTRLGVNMVGSRLMATACGWMRWRRRCKTSSARTSSRNTSTPSRRCRIPPAPSCPSRAASNC